MIGPRGIYKLILAAIPAAIAVIDGYHDVPGIDSADNNQMRDVIGNKSDGHTSSSIRGKVHLTEEHLHPEGVFCYPELAASVLLTKAAGAYAAYPTPTEIIPVNTITSDFDLHYLSITAASANGEYTIALYTGLGGAEVKIGCYSFVKIAGGGLDGTRPIGTILIPANTRISAAISSDNAAADTCLAKLEGHTY